MHVCVFTCVAQALRTKGLHSLPVVDAQSKAIVGVLSLAGLTKLRTSSKGGPLNSTKLVR
jgi:CBS-domain-containing membrane protein